MPYRWTDPWAIILCSVMLWSARVGADTFSSMQPCFQANDMQNLSILNRPAPSTGLPCWRGKCLSWCWTLHHWSCLLSPPNVEESEAPPYRPLGTCVSVSSGSRHCHFEKHSLGMVGLTQNTLRKVNSKCKTPRRYSSVGYDCEGCQKYGDIKERIYIFCVH